MRYFKIYVAGLLLLCVLQATTCSQVLSTFQLDSAKFVQLSDDRLYDTVSKTYLFPYSSLERVHGDRYLPGTKLLRIPFTYPAGMLAHQKFKASSEAPFLVAQKNKGGRGYHVYCDHCPFDTKNIIVNNEVVGQTFGDPIIDSDYSRAAYKIVDLVDQSNLEKLLRRAPAASLLVFGHLIPGGLSDNFVLRFAHSLGKATVATLTSYFCHPVYGEVKFLEQENLPELSQIAYAHDAVVKFAQDRVAEKGATIITHALIDRAWGELKRSSVFQAMTDNEKVKALIDYYERKMPDCVKKRAGTAVMMACNNLISRFVVGPAVNGCTRFIKSRVSAVP